MTRLTVNSDVSEWLMQTAGSAKTIALAKLLMAQGQPGRAADILDTSLITKSTTTDRNRAISILMAGGKSDRCEEVCNSLLNDPEIEKHPKLKHRALHTLGLLEQYTVGSRFLSEALPISGTPKGLVAFYNVMNPIVSGLMVPLAYRLAQDGYLSAAVVAGTIEVPASGIPAFDRLGGCIMPDGESFVGQPQRTTLRNEWQIDWRAKIVEAGGINYFAYFHERVSQNARRYSADITTDDVAATYFESLLKKSDVALSFCLDLQSLAEKTSLPIRVATMDSHFAPAGIIREWCYQFGARRGIHTLAMGVGYENYFSNLSTTAAGTLVIDDLTAQPSIRVPVLGGEYRFKKFMEEFPEKATSDVSDVLPMISQNRSQTEEGSEERTQILSRVRLARSAGNKAFLVMGKVSIDFAAPGDKGWAHTDFIDWLEHLISSVANSPNLLLVKPHPHELRKEIVVNGVEMLRDMIRKDLPDNVIFLPHNALNSYELAPDIDGAFIWNGMGTLEFPVLGVPVVAASIWAPRDYAVQSNILRTREEYEEVLSGKRELPPPSAENKRLAAVYLRFLKSESLSIPFRYLRRAAVNAYIGPPTLYAEDLERLRSEGDKNVDRAASRFFEFATGRD